jgi:TonB family protein
MSGKGRVDQARAEVGVIRGIIAPRLPQKQEQRYVSSKGSDSVSGIGFGSVTVFRTRPTEGWEGCPTSKFIYRISPDYPDAWKRQGLQGTVHLQAVIAKDGSVQNVTVIDGDPLLAKSAANALKKWRYKPTMVNGEPVDVQTTIAIVFALNPVKK